MAASGTGCLTAKNTEIAKESKTACLDQWIVEMRNGRTEGGTGDSPVPGFDDEDDDNDPLPPSANRFNASTHHAST